MMLKRLGPYRIERLLGRGGMGTVYAGTHVETGEQAAIKSLAFTLEDDRSFRARFLAEIETLKQLRHPNIVRMIGDGEQDGHLFYVMELVEGRSLQDVLQAGQTFDWKEVMRIAIDVSSALKHAHDCGVIHRDLKPANLLRTPEGQIKLTDFGIAKLFGATHRTADGSVVGTADYMSPEQADGRPVTNRSDLYSLGAVMFTLLARRTPFAGGSLPQVIHKLKYEAAPSVRRFAPDVPEDLEHLIGELLRKEPAERVATALVLTNRLRAMEHALNVREPEPPAPDQATTRILDPDQQGDCATLPPGAVAGQQPATKISPTHSDKANDEAARNYSWNDATISTSSPASRGFDATIPPSKEVSLEPVELPRNRFTTLEEYERAGTLRQDAEQTPGSHLSTVGLALAVLAVVGLIIWGVSPPSADSLYRRIQRTVAAGGPAEAIKDLESFTKRFPDDPRFAEVENLRQDVEGEFLASRLGLRKRKSNGHDLAPFEEEWLDAFHLRKKDVQAAREKFAGIVEQYGQTADPSPELATVLAASRHQLERIPQPK